MDYKTILNQASNLLKNYRIKSARLDSELLLSSLLKISRESLLLNLNKEIKINENKKFKLLLEKRAKKVPVAYILGYKDFWKSKFLVNNSVLIPRPETELIVEESLTITIDILASHLSVYKLISFKSFFNDSQSLYIGIKILIFI